MLQPNICTGFSAWRRVQSQSPEEAEGGLHCSPALGMTGTGWRLDVAPLLLLVVAKSTVLHTTEHCCVSDCTIQQNAMRLKRLKIKSSAREG